MTAEDVRIKQMAHQHLCGRTDAMTAVHDLCGLQAQVLSHAVHALRIRAEDADEQPASGGLVRSWTLRGTMHLFATDDLPLFVSCFGEHIRQNDWRHASFWNQRACWALTPARQAYFTEVILDALSDGPQTREALIAQCRAHGMTDAERGSMFDPWGGGIREMCERGFICGLPQEQKAYALVPSFVPMEKESARLELARRYFTHMGPATVRDAAYFFSVSQRQVKKWLDALPVTAQSCGGRDYFSIGQGTDDVSDVPACVFLAGFDQLLLGYDKRDSLYLRTEDVRKVFGRSGSVAPAVLLRGSVAGTWKRRGGRTEVSLFAPVDAAAREATERTAHDLWGGGCLIRDPA